MELYYTGGHEPGHRSIRRHFLEELSSRNRSHIHLLDRFAIACMVGADLCVAPDFVYRRHRDPTQVCPYIDLQQPCDIPLTSLDAPRLTRRTHCGRAGLRGHSPSRCWSLSAGPYPTAASHLVNAEP